MAQPQTDLITIQEAMVGAVDESAAKRQEALVPYPLKVVAEHKQECEEICERNGTTLPIFLRQCMNSLILDYRPVESGE